LFLNLVNAMRRRESIAVLGGAAGWPVTVYAQQAKPTPRVAVLLISGPEDVEAQSLVNALKQGLAVLGWTDGAPSGRLRANSCTLRNRPQRSPLS